MKWPFQKRVLRHGDPNPPSFVGGDSPHLQEFEKHLKANLGEASTVIHEIASQYVHIDVHVVPPTAGREFHTLVTCGMGDKPMKVPTQMKGKGVDFAELMLCLPPSWEMGAYEVMGGDKSEKHWPVAWLRDLARFPHRFNTWFSWGHSLPNGDPALPLSPETEMCGWVLLEPKLVSNSFKIWRRDDGSRVFIHAAVPVDKEEMAIKIAQGAERLEDLLAEFGITELVDPKRKNVATKIEPRI